MDKEQKNIILDLDGTLIDSERVMLKSIKEYADLKKVEYTDDFLLQFVGARPEDIGAILINKYGADFDVVGFLRGAEEYFNNSLLINLTPLLPGAVELLTYLREDGWKTALATNTHKEVVYSEIERHDLRKFFDVVVTGDILTKHKPSPEIYIKTCEMLGVLPENCFAVEDSTVGVISATTAGMKTLVIPDLHEVRADLKPLCTGIFESCFALIDYLKAL